MFVHELLRAHAYAIYVQWKIHFQNLPNDEKNLQSRSRFINIRALVATIISHTHGNNILPGSFRKDMQEEKRVEIKQDWRNKEAFFRKRDKNKKKRKKKEEEREKKRRNSRRL